MSRIAWQELLLILVCLVFSPNRSLSTHPVQYTFTICLSTCQTF